MIISVKIEERRTFLKIMYKSTIYNVSHSLKIYPFTDGFEVDVS